MIVISKNLVLSEPEQFGLNNPLIGYENLVTMINVEATSSEDNYPATNLANPATYAMWKATSAVAQDLDFTIDAECEYVGIARHNLGTQHIGVTIYGATETDSDGNPDFDDTPLVEEQMPSNDAPLMFRFTRQSLLAVRVHLAAGDGAPQIAVVYVGNLLTLQRRIYVGHTPITMGRQNRYQTSGSESGQYVGSILIAESRATSISMKNLTPDWYRTYFEPFLSTQKRTPFFFAWRPQDYPDEVGYVWMTTDPRPLNALSNGMMAVDMAVEGIS